MSKKSLVFLFFVAVVIMLTVAGYMDYIQKEKKSLEQEMYKEEALFMQKNVAAMIEEKKKATTAIALTLASNNALQNFLADTKELHYKFNILIENFKKYTNYQNIWIHILDKNAHSLYRSWTKVNDDSFCKKRADLRYVIEHKKVLSDISVDIFSLNIKAIVPLFNQKQEFIGLVEVISHFNSIAKGLKKLDIDSVVLLNKIDSQNIKYPFSNKYVGDYYVANFDAPQVLQDYLKKNIRQYFQSTTNLTDDYIIASYPLKDLNNKTIAYYIMFKKVSAVSKVGLEFFVFKWSILAIVGLMALAGVINIWLYYILRRQKSYYKKILDTSSNIVLITDKKTVIDANKTFFEYFKNYVSVKEFNKKNNCICDFFVDEDGYIARGDNMHSWLETILKSPEEIHKVKVHIDQKTYYFIISVSLISAEKNHYSVIFSDITEQELYKNELEQLSLHDSLTKVGNRRKLDKRLKEEIQRSCRYKHPLSLIFYDLDFFKKVNDTMGHTIGDNVLVEYSHLVASLLRNVDELFRVGGEEFVVILPNTTKESAANLAEKLRSAVEKHKKIVPITASFGVTDFIICEDVESFYQRADEALYAAKNSGRNRVVVK